MKPAACAVVSVVACLAGGLWPCATYAAGWPDVPVPEGARGELVSDDMVYNGLSMRASTFQVGQDMESVKAFYRAKWGASMVVTPRKGGLVLGHMEDGEYYVTIALNGMGKSTSGQIGVMRLPTKPVPANSVGSGFERPPGTQVGEDIVYKDTPRHVRTLSMVNAYSPMQNEQFYSRRLTAQGYVQEGSEGPCVDTSTSCVSRYARGEDRVTVTSTRNRGSTTIVAVIE